MKKIFAILLAVVLVFSLSATAFADNYVNSIANAGDTKLISATDANGEDATIRFVLTPFNERDRLPADLLALIKEAYNSLKNGKLTDVNEDLEKAASDKDIAVSDLFDLRVAPGVEVAFPATIRLQNQNLDNFVALLHYVDGEWLWVDTEVNDDELSFVVDSLSPFAIVVAAEPVTSAQTGETANVGFIAAAVVFAAAAGYFFTKSRKVKA